MRRISGGRTGLSAAAVACALVAALLSACSGATGATDVADEASPAPRSQDVSPSMWSPEAAWVLEDDAFMPTLPEVEADPSTLGKPWAVSEVRKCRVGDGLSQGYGAASYVYGDDGMLREMQRWTYHPDETFLIQAEEGEPQITSRVVYEGSGRAEGGETVTSVTTYNAQGEPTSTSATYAGTTEDGVAYEREELDGELVGYTTTETTEDGSRRVVTTYDGEMAPENVSGTSVTTLDEKGRPLSRTGVESPLENGIIISAEDLTIRESDAGTYWAYDDATGASTELYVNLEDGETIGPPGMGRYEFQAKDENGCVYYRRYAGNTMGTQDNTRHEYTEYDESGNPTMQITSLWGYPLGANIEEKVEFTYDENGNLLYAVQGNYYDDGELDDYFVWTFGYVNTETGERIEPTSALDVAAPALSDEDKDPLPSRRAFEELDYQCPMWGYFATPEGATAMVEGEEYEVMLYVSMSTDYVAQLGGTFSMAAPGSSDASSEYVFFVPISDDTELMCTTARGTSFVVSYPDDATAHVEGRRVDGTALSFDLARQETPPDWGV